MVNGQVTGVRLASGDEVRAKKVVSAAGVSSTVQRLLPAGYRAATWATSVAKLPPAPAHVCLYLGFKGDVKAAGASAATSRGSACATTAAKTPTSDTAPSRGARSRRRSRRARWLLNVVLRILKSESRGLVLVESQPFER